MAFWQGRRVLVTGAAGYLAGRLMQALAHRGAAIVGTDIRPSTAPGPEMAFEQADLLDLSAVEEALRRFEIVTAFHLAGNAGVAYCEEHPLEAFASNCQATWSFLEASRRYGRMSEIIITSSNHAYGLQDTIPTPEDAALRPEGVYAVSKACADHVARSYAHSTGLPVGVARITNTFGGFDRHTDHLVTGTILAVLAGRRPVIRGNGTAVKGYLYVTDTIEGLVRFAERLRTQHLRGEAINFSPDAPVSVREIVDEVIRLMGADTTPIVQGEPSRREEFQHLLNDKARRLLGWRPQYGLEDGLRAAIADLREHARAESARP